MIPAVRRSRSMRNRRVGLWTGFALAVAGLASLWMAGSALACSCAGPERPLSLEGEDAAITARLIEVRRESNSSDATFRYKVRRVFKGRHEYGLHRGTRLAIESSVSGASCGLPRGRDRLHGLILYEYRRELQSNLCLAVAPRALRRAARRRGEDDGAATRQAARSIATGCATQRRVSS